MVSDQGDVISLERRIHCIAPNGKPATRWAPAAKLRFFYGGRNKRYRRVHLHGPGNEWIHAYVHVLVCTAFHGPRPPETMCCHRDDDQSNNTAENLYWGSPSENRTDRLVNSVVSGDSETWCEGDPW